MRFLAAIKLGSKSKCVDPKAKPNRNFFRDNLCLPLESAFINRKHSFQNSRSNYVAPPLTLHPSFDSVLCPSFDSFGYLASPRIWTSCKTDRRDKWGGGLFYPVTKWCCFRLCLFFLSEMKPSAFFLELCKANIDPVKALVFEVFAALHFGLNEGLNYD